MVKWFNDRVRLAWIMVPFFVLAACGAAVSQESSSDFYAGAAAVPPESAAAEPVDVMREESVFDTAVDGSLANAVQAEQERLIIRTGELSIIVADTEESVAQIAALAGEMGGWVVSSSLNQYGTAKSGDITLRIPAEKFDAAMTEIKAAAIEVTFESTSGQDVTEEYVDLSARLGNLEATAERVRGFLDETQSVEEALAVNMELSRLEGEIEAMKGRLQYLSQSAAFSTIHVSLTPDELAQPIEVAGWRPQGVAKDAIETLVDALQGIGSFLIWLGLFVLPLAAVICLPLYLLLRWAVRRWRRRPVAG